MDSSQERRQWRAVLDVLAAVLAEKSGDGWLVGGCLRDVLLGAAVTDVDVALTIPPLPVAERLASTLRAFVARLGHGTIRLALTRDARVHLDLTPLQGESMQDDLCRRDFTVNAMALPLASRGEWVAFITGRGGDLRHLLDPFGGHRDALAHRLVAVGPDVFRADPGRVVRAARLRARFELMPDAGTLRLMREAAPLLNTLSADRLREEIELLLALPTATDGVELLNEVSALPELFKDIDGDTAAHVLETLRRLDRLMGTSAGGVDYPALSAWTASEARRVAIRQAVLIHACTPHDDGVTASSTLWDKALAVLEAADERERLHRARLLFMDAGQHDETAVDALLVAAACGRIRDSQLRATPLAARANALVDTYLYHREKLIPPALLRGSDLTAALGVKPGPSVGRLLRAVRLEQLADEITSREEALALARRLNDASG